MSFNKNHEPSYEGDYFGWVHHQAEFLKNRQYGKVDMDNLIEEIESLGNSERNKLESHLKIILLHMLKIKFQPSYHTRSWDLSIKNSNYHAKKTLTKNPSLKRELDEIFNDAYFSARLEAAQQTGLDEEMFPKKSPWTIDEILEENK